MQQVMDLVRAYTPPGGDMVPEDALMGAALLELMPQATACVPVELLVEKFADACAAASRDEKTHTFSSEPLTDAFRRQLQRSGADLATEES